MNIDQIHVEWATDCDINLAELSEEARRVPNLHAKYMRYYTDEHTKLRRLRAEHSKLLALKKDYYLGEMPKEELDELGWEPFQKRVLKNEIKEYIDVDKHVIKHNLKIGEQDEIVELLESILRSINNRGYLLKTALDFERFKTGAM